MRKLLEVIVTSKEDAMEAEAGGADRLELVRDLPVGGLTPDFDLAAEVVASVRRPVRVMLRETPDMAAHGAAAIHRLQRCASRFAQLPIDGLVFGFTEQGILDRSATSAVMDAAPACRFTFHRAFDELNDPLSALEDLKSLRRIDRILTVGGEGKWTDRKSRLLEWQRAIAPQITLLVGAGLAEKVLLDLASTPELLEVHIGRAARLDRLPENPVRRGAVRAVRSVLE